MDTSTTWYALGLEIPATSLLPRKLQENETATAAAPSEAPTIFLEQVYRSQGLYITAMSLGTAAVLLCLGSMLFVHRYKHKQVVAVAQPPFLQLMLVGTLLVSITIFFIGLDEQTAKRFSSSDDLSTLCMVDVWIWYIGYMFLYCSLFSKLLRVYKVTRFQRNQRILPKHVIGPFVLLMVATLAVLIAYTIVNPSVWERGAFVSWDDDYYTDDNWWEVYPGELKAYGYCTENAGFDDALFGMLILSCVLCLFMACKVRKIPEELSDSRRIFQLILVQIIMATIGLTVGYVIGGDNGTINLVVGMEIVVSFLWVLSTICFLIVPKMYYVWYEGKHGHLPEGIRGIAGGRIHVSGVYSNGSGTETSASALRLSRSSLRRMAAEKEQEDQNVTADTLTETPSQNPEIEEAQHVEQEQGESVKNGDCNDRDGPRPLTKQTAPPNRFVTMTQLLVMALLCTTVDAAAVPDPLPLSQTSNLFSGRSRRSTFRYRSFAGSDTNSHTKITLTSSKAKQKELEERYPEFAFRDLGPVGKVVAGVTEIVFATLFEYLSGFMTGIFFGTMVGFPGFVFRPIEKGVRQPLVQEAKKRFARMNTRSMTWAKSFGSMSAAFGGFGVAARVIRNGEEDVWNTILSSAAAGAFFARKEGPEAMVRGALLYGGLIYLISGGGFGGTRKQLQEYTDRPMS